MAMKSNWTVMIYMAGDNNLSVDMAYTLGELKEKMGINNAEKISLFVRFQNNSAETSDLFCDFSEVDSPFYIFSNEIENKVRTHQNSNKSSSDANDPLVEFVSWSIDRNESPNNLHALILAGHTMGFLSDGLLKSESKNASMTMSGLQTSLKNIKEEIIGKKLSILGFDSCVMGMFEVGHQFETVAETMIASEGSLPNAGWSYSKFLGSLLCENNDAKNVSREVVQKYITEQSQYAIGGISVDMAAWDLERLDKLSPKLELLAKNLFMCFEDPSNATYSQMRRILLHVHYKCQTYMLDQCIDLGDFCSLLVEEIESVTHETGRELDKSLLEICVNSEAILEEIDKCVIQSGFSGGAYQFSTGISLFFPWSLNAYSVSAHDYEQLHFVKNTTAGRLWNQFLRKYLFEVSRRKAKTESESLSICYSPTNTKPDQTNLINI